MSSVIQLTRGVPAAESFPTARLAECAQAVFAQAGNVVLQYGKSGGYPPLRALIAGEVDVDENRVIVAPGTLQLQDFCFHALLEAGDLVYVEEPTYDRTLTLLRRRGAKIVSFPLEDDGPDVDDVEARLREGEKPVIFYIIPDFQNPSGTVASAEKRRRLAALAERYGFWIVEDVPYRKLRYRGEEPPSLFDLAPNGVIQMSSYSKQIGPGLRVGYVILPQSLAPRLLKYAEDTYISANYLDQAIVSEFIQRGWLEPQLAALKALYTPRLDAVLAALEADMSEMGRWPKPDGGFFVGLTLSKPASTDELLARAKEAGLSLTDGRGFFATASGDGFIRLPFCALAPEEIREGISRLAGVVRAL
ncbi:MAG: PLP-dependent aminotransferase family protein [Thermoflexales bacterium]|nr:PLP-dependent aminotransferase family protein [Thermoflexales bacterium]